MYMSVFWKLKCFFHILIEPDMLSSQLAAVLALLDIELADKFTARVIVFLLFDCHPLVDIEKAS